MGRLQRPSKRPVYFKENRQFASFLLVICEGEEGRREEILQIPFERFAYLFHGAVGGNSDEDPVNVFPEHFLASFKLLFGVYFLSGVAGEGGWESGFWYVWAHHISHVHGVVARAQAARHST